MFEGECSSQVTGIPEMLAETRFLATLGMTSRIPNPNDSQYPKSE
jgi:hypothetical protein